MYKELTEGVVTRSIRLAGGMLEIDKDGEGNDQGDRGTGPLGGGQGEGAGEDRPRRLYKRVLLDGLHLIMRYASGLATTSRDEPLFGLFHSALAQAIYMLDEMDVQAAVNHLLVRGLPKKDIQRLPVKYFMRRCRRSIPPPDVLAARVTAVIKAFESCVMLNGKMLYKDGKDGMLAIHKLQLTHIHGGCVSDPPNMQMYYVIGRCASGLPIYGCKRGTVALEGWHRFLRDIDCDAASPELVDLFSMCRAHRWNISAAIKHRGRFDFRTFDTELLDLLYDAEWLAFGYRLDYERTPPAPSDPTVWEDFGCSAAKSEFADLGVAPVDDELAGLDDEAPPTVLDDLVTGVRGASKTAVEWLAHELGLPFAFGPISSTPQGMQRFQQVLREPGALPPEGSKGGIDWDKLARIFNIKAQEEHKLRREKETRDMVEKWMTARFGESYDVTSAEVKMATKVASPVPQSPSLQGSAHWFSSLTRAHLGNTPHTTFPPPFPPSCPRQGLHDPGQGGGLEDEDERDADHGAALPQLRPEGRPQQALEGPHQELGHAHAAIRRAPGEGEPPQRPIRRARGEGRGARC